MSTRTIRPDIVDSRAILDLVADWTKSINLHDVPGMLAAQKKLRADHNVWLTLGTDSRRGDR